MPELPEVETTRRGIAPHLTGQVVSRVVVRQPRLRWPVPADLGDRLCGQTIQAVGRRAKYLLLGLGNGTLILHLGMSGSLRIVPASTPSGKHDHVDLILAGGECLRLTDPRRFGAVIWCEAPERHTLLSGLGPEPLGEAFDGGYLFERSRNKGVTIKQFIMDSKVVVGIGNIYANEALFRAGIHPARAAGRIARARHERLAAAIRCVLEAAIAQGGTTLRDFVGGDGRPGYFAQELQVYGKPGEPCPRCATPIRQIQLGQRSTYFCPRCQT